MKSSVSVFFTIMVLALLIFACSRSDENTGGDSKSELKLSNIRWGITLDEVKFSETGTPYEEKDNLILYKDQFEDIDSTLGYIFEDGKLVKAGYLFYENYEQPDKYIEDYERVKGVLIDNLGAPVLDEVKWTDEEQIDQADPTGKAVCEGEIIYRSQWVSEDSVVTMHLEGANNKCRQGVIFESKEHFEAEQDKMESTGSEVDEK